jgi:hypothetical protein
MPFDEEPTSFTLVRNEADLIQSPSTDTPLIRGLRRDRRADADRFP